jgi:glycosyltransferase involved in cell wall biosynthesis
VLCQYELLENRVGGMDEFYWAFDRYCKDRAVMIDWFFPNTASHGDYPQMSILSSEGQSMEQFFLSHLKTTEMTYDCVMTHFLELSTVFAKNLKNLTTAKFIQVDHNPRPLGGYLFKKRIKKRLKGLLYSAYVDQFVGVSKNTAYEIVHDFGPRVQGKTTTIYNGVNLSKIKKRTALKNNGPRGIGDKRPLKLLVVSHLRPSKGIQDLIQAVAVLKREENFDQIIDIYGDGPYRQRLEKMTHDLGVRNNFKFLGSMDVRKVYANYDCLIHPSHMECMSLTLLEALTAGLWVITTKVGGTPEIINHDKNGWLYEAGKTSELIKLLKDVEMSQNGNQALTYQNGSNLFDVENMVQDYFKLK